MSEGRWVWVPEGWRVVPEIPTAEMRSELRLVSLSHAEAMWRAGCDAAPEPPSGWKKGYPPARVYWQEGLYHRQHVSLGYWDNECMVAWHTLLPPPPE